MANDLEFASLIGAISDACQTGQDASARAQRSLDLIDIIRDFSPKIAAMRDTAVADALDVQASFYWEASTLLEPARKAARAAGEEGMEGLLGAQIETMREVSARLRRRAAEIRGVPPEEAAARDALGQPAAPAAAPVAVAESLPPVPFTVACNCPCCMRATCDCADRPDNAHCSCELCAGFTPPPDGDVPAPESEG